MTRSLRRLALLSWALVPLAGMAQVTFSFNFNDAGTGFNDATAGAARRTALQSAAGMLSSYFTSYPARTVTFDVTSVNNVGSGFLASAGSNVSGITVDGFYKTDAQKMIQNGTGPGTGQIQWNFGYTYDYDDIVGAGTYDFKSIAMHEMLHALGFFSFISSDGSGGFHNAPVGSVSDVWSIFDRYLTNSSDSHLVNNSTFIFNSGLIGTLTGGPGTGMFFDGPNAVAAYGGLVPIYSPTTWAQGSSGSHLDTDVFGVNNYIMTHAVGTGPSLRTLSGIEIGILTDLGYTISAIPEPATWGLMVGAASLMVVGLRRRQPS